MKYHIFTLQYLKEREDDGQMHNLKYLFPNLPTSSKKVIFKDLAEANLIKFVSGKLEDNIEGESEFINYTFKKLGMRELMGEITFSGAKFLKEEIYMEESGKYNINYVEWVEENIIVDQSDYTAIHSKPDFSEKLDQIIQILKADESITEEKEMAISDFHNAKVKVNSSGKLPDELWYIISEYQKIESIAGLIDDLESMYEY